MAGKVFFATVIPENLKQPACARVPYALHDSSGLDEVFRMHQKVQILTGLQLPEGVCDFSSWPEPTADETTAISNTLNRHNRPDIKLRLRLSACATSRQKARFLIKFIVPKPDLMRVYYPDGTPVFFCYFRLWGRWADEIMRFIVNCTHSGKIKAPRS